MEFRIGVNLGDVIVGASRYIATASMSPLDWKASRRPVASASPETCMIRSKADWRSTIRTSDFVQHLRKPFRNTTAGDHRAENGSSNPCSAWAMAAWTMVSVDPATGTATKIVNLVGSNLIMGWLSAGMASFMGPIIVPNPGLYLIDMETGFEQAIAALPPGVGFSSGLELANPVGSDPNTEGDR
jgi:hypothetical protein